MESLQAHNFGCQELDATTAKEVNGGFLNISLTNTNGKINAGVQLDTNALGLGGLGTGGGSLPGLGGLGNLGSLLSPVTNLLNSLLGGLGGIVPGL